MKQKLLITAADELELASLSEQLQAEAIILKPIGIGLLAASHNLSLVLKAQPEINQVLFIGSAGTNNPQQPLLEAVSAKSVSLVDSALVENKAYAPHGHKTIKADFYLPELKQAAFYSALSITSDAKLAELYRTETEASIENMELYAVAYVCQAMAIPWGAVSVITNYTSPSAHQQWLDNRMQAAKITAENILIWLNKTSDLI